MPAPRCCRASANLPITPFRPPIRLSTSSPMWEGGSAGTALPCPARSICRGATIHTAGSSRAGRRSRRELFHFVDDCITHLGGAHDCAAVGLDIRGAQPLGENGRDRTIDQAGFLVAAEG